MTTTYTVDQSRLSAYRRKSALSSFLLYGSLGAVTVLLVNRGNFSPSGLISMAAGLSVTLLFISLFVWASPRALNRQAATMRVVLDDEAITRAVADVPSISLRLAEVSAPARDKQVALLAALS